MAKALEILLLIVVPLAWGLGFDYVFERVCRLRGRPRSREEGE